MPTTPLTPSQHDPVELGREVVRACLGLGFAAAGIARAEPSSRSAELRAWLAAGKHGTMAWMEEYLDERLDVTQLLPGAKAVIVVADAYAAPGSGSDPAMQAGCEREDGPVTGSIARYARGEDYHSVLKRRLKRLADRLRMLPAAAAAAGGMGGAGGARETVFRTFVDTGPAMEREHAARAGLGWIGKHTLLINPARGSWFVLGGIATTLDIAPEPDATPIADHCGTCTRCIDACPTQAITPYSVDARRCVSYLTIEHDGVIDQALHGGIGDRLIGCDVCQEVCPFNGHEQGVTHAASGESSGRSMQVNEAYLSARGTGPTLSLLEVLGWNEADRTRAMTLSAAKRVSLAMLKRNALITAGNAVAAGSAGSHAAAVRERILAIADDEREDAVVRQTAAQVAERLG